MGILKNHFALSLAQYRAGILSGKYDVTWPNSLSVEQIPATLQNYKPLVKLLGSKWDWDRQPRYSGASLEDKLMRGELFLLKDAGRTVGYAFAAAVGPATRERFWPGAERVMEIENLGMFPGEEGRGRGKAYFEMLFQRYFQSHDVVYWSQHETHSPTLRRFYQEKMGMTLLARDEVEDFRAQQKAPALEAAR